MENSASIVITGLYSSEEGDLRLLDEQTGKRKGRPKKLANFNEDNDSMRIPKMLMCSTKENSLYQQLVRSMDFLQIDMKELTQKSIDTYS